ncbi:MAG: peptidoglycan-binding protein [Myxococcota bacterium]
MAIQLPTVRQPVVQPASESPLAERPNDRVPALGADVSTAARALVSSGQVEGLTLQEPTTVARGSASTGRRIGVSLDRAIDQGTVIGPGDHGPAVTEMQQRLTAEGFGVQATGRFGLTTAGVLRDFQRANGIQPTGRYGPTTHAAMERAERGTHVETPMVDQNTLNHPRSWAFCGIATTMMVLDANDLPLPANSEQALTDFSSGMYIPGSGTSGAGMAQALRDRGLEAQYTQTGSASDITATLDRGQPVPVGVLSVSGEVIELPNGRSARYDGLRPGDDHQHTFGESGHWLVVDGYEGSADSPSHFTVSDPDSGARLRMSAAEFRAMAGVDGDVWMVEL